MSLASICLALTLAAGAGTPTPEPTVFGKDADTIGIGLRGKSPITGWAASFPPEVVATYLDSEGAAVLVASAGTPVGTTREAASALEAALRASGKAKLVMNDSALGDLSSASDEEVLAKCKSLPVKVLAVVRTFAQAGKPASAVVTFRGLDGKVFAALATEVGTPAERLQAQTATQGVSNRAMGSIEAIIGTGSRGSPEEQFKDQALSVKTFGSDWYLYSGKSRLDEEQFFELVDRLDLRDAFRARRTLKTTLKSAGIVAMIGGASWSLVNAFGTCRKVRSTHDDVSFDDQCLDNDYSGLAPGLGVAAVGVALSITAAILDSHTATQQEAEGEAKKHNQKLRKELKLEDADGAGGLGLRGSAKQMGGDSLLSLQVSF